jgi:hypothetical protein
LACGVEVELALLAGDLVEYRDEYCVCECDLEGIGSTEIIAAR